MDVDLGPTPCDPDEEVGEVPEWWLQTDDLDEVLGMHMSPRIAFGTGESWIPYTQWALENGIAPGQPFQLEIDLPTVHRSGWETIEYDVEWQFIVVQVQPLPAVRAAQRWARHFRKLAASSELDRRESIERREHLLRNTGAMTVRRELFIGTWSGSGKDRTRFTLYGPRNAYIASGECEDGDKEAEKSTYAQVAFDRMVKDACEKSPYLNPEVIHDIYNG
jgi:hypothetical protein